MTQDQERLLDEILAEAKANAENMPTSEETEDRQRAINELRKTLLGQS